jgi:hypothetical protein
MNIRLGRLAVSAVAATWIGAGAGVSIVSSPASATAAASHHASPFGLHSRRDPALRTASHSTAASTITNTSTAIEWVSNSMPVGTNTSCANPGYETISAALAAAASGTTIKVCSGTYQEQLAITQSVTLDAVGAVTVLGPPAPASNVTACDADGGSQPNQDVVDICGTGITVGITGFTIQGSWPSDVCYNSIYGLAVLGGANLDLSNSTVENIGGNPLTDGCQGGVGIEVGLATSGTTADPGTATLINDVVSNYQKNGITVDGAGSFAKVVGVSVEGAGPSPAIAQNGIQVSDAAGGTISGSFVSGDECNDTSGGCGPNGFTQVQSAGILLFDASTTTVSTTNVASSDIGVYTIQDFAWTFYTPPSAFAPVLQSFGGLGLANRYENAYFDEGKATISGSRMSGGEVGLEVGQWNGQMTPAVGSAGTDTITSSSADAVLVASDQAAGDLRVSLKVLDSGLDTTNAGGIANQSFSILHVTQDWWGDATGPSVWGFGSGSSVSSDVNFFPWATDATFTTVAACTTGLSQTTTNNDAVLCAKPGTGNAFLANSGSGKVLLIGNNGNDQLVGSASGGETWIIAGTVGSNVINGNNGTGYIQPRGNTHDTVINASSYTVAPN